MSIIAVHKEKVEKEAGVVILPLKEYRKLIARAVPVYYLAGREAAKLDKLVGYGFKEYKAGKARKITSLADLD